MMRRAALAVLVAVLGSFSDSPAAVAQNRNWGYVQGRVTDENTGAPIPGVTVLVYGTNYGTAADDEGAYAMPLPAGRHVLRFSTVGYAPRLDTLEVLKEGRHTLDVVLAERPVGLGEITVEAAAATAEAGVHTIDPAVIEAVPAPLYDGFRVLKTLPGVASNNETSSEYSVHGGGYNENLVFINGYEVFKSFRLRKGEQEGQGIVNPTLAGRYTFYTGGFPARYGGKLSSALDVEYRRPDEGGVHGTVVASLLETAATVGAATQDGRLGGVVGVRRATTQHFFSTQDLEGSYRPGFADVQALVGYRPAPGHEVEALGVWMRDRFRFVPRARSTFYGTRYDLRRVTAAYQGREDDRYVTRLGGLRLKSQIAPRLRAEHDVSYYETDEDERSSVQGVNVFFSVVLDPVTLQIDTTFADGAFTEEEEHLNRVRVRTLTGQGRWMMHGDRHAAEAGWYARRLTFEDRLHEASFIESIADSIGLMWFRNPAGITQLHPDSIEVVDFSGAARLHAAQAGVYVQDAVDLLPARDRLVLTAGLRGDYFSFNDEMTLSPRLSVRFQYTPDLVLVGSWGVYHQAPTYRELRGDPVPGEPLETALNRGLRAQRSVQASAGAEYFSPRSRLYFRGEVYYRHLDRLITYDVDNIRVSYSGLNDARGFTYGLDLQVRGEFLPGFESWAGYSYMRSRERFLPAYVTPETEGWMPRPMDQAHTASLVIQDYLPGNPTWMMNLRFLYGSGFPYTPPVAAPGPRGTTIQVPGRRNAYRFVPYFRIDLAFSKAIALGGPAEAPRRLRLTAALLNLFDNANTVRHDWAPGSDGLWERIPTRLTPRTFNLRARLDF